MLRQTPRPILAHVAHGRDRERVVPQHRGQVARFGYRAATDEGNAVHRATPARAGVGTAGDGMASARGAGFARTPDAR
jgi:hypothetical protein